jgi:hypothetical protein
MTARVFRQLFNANDFLPQMSRSNEKGDGPIFDEVAGDVRDLNHGPARERNPVVGARFRIVCVDRGAAMAGRLLLVEPTEAALIGF